jgi:hypothetical protein
VLESFDVCLFGVHLTSCFLIKSLPPPFVTIFTIALSQLYGLESLSNSVSEPMINPKKNRKAFLFYEEYREVTVHSHKAEESNATYINLAF